MRPQKNSFKQAKMARKKGPSLAKKKSGKSKPRSGPANGVNPESGEIEVNTDIGLDGVGIDVEVSEYGSTAVDIVIDFDISPIELDFDYDPTANELSGGIELGLPGDLIGITGGMTVNTETGEITAITGGVAIAGMEVEIEKGVGKYSCRTVSTFTFFGIGYSVTENNCKDENEGEGTDEAIEEGEHPAGFDAPAVEIDPDLFPRNKIILAVMDGRYGRFFIDERGLWSTFKIQRGRIEQMYDPEKWPVLFKEEPGKIYYPPDGWNYGATITYSRKDPLVLSSDKDKVETLQESSMFPLYGSNSPFCLTTVDSGNGSISSCFFGTYYNFVQWITGKTYFYGYDASRAPLEMPPGDYEYPLFVSAILPNGFKIYSQKSGERTLIGIRFYDESGLILELPKKPPPRPRPRFRPRPYRRRRENPMNENCCQAIYQLLTGVANVTGVAEHYQYPFPFSINGKQVQSFNLLHYLALQQSMFPIEIEIQENVTDKRPVKVKVHNVPELLLLIGNSTGYKKNAWKLTLKLDKDKRDFTYRSSADATMDLVKAFAPHKILYANKDKGYAIPMEQLFPGAKNYDTTKDYPGILTRLFSAVQRYGFDSPIYIKVKDANPAIEGDQESGFEVENLAGAVEKLLYNSVEIRSDVDVLTNLSIRASYLSSRIYQIAVRLWYRLTAILDGLGIATKRDTTEIPCEVNPLANVRFKRGFEDNNDDLDLTPSPSNLDLHDDDTTEKMLPEFLKNSKIPQVIDRFKGKTPSIFKLLSKIKG